MNRIRFYAEAEIDLCMQQGQFFRRCQFASEREEKEFYALQSELRKKLENSLSSAYGMKIFVSDYLWPNESLKIDISQQLLSPKLMLVNLRFLKAEAPSYCILSAIYSDSELKGSGYLGRILISGKQISVEESVRGIFKSKCLTNKVHD